MKLSALLSKSSPAALALGIGLISCVAPPKATLDLQLLNELPPGAGWEYLRGRERAPFPLQCRLHEDGVSVSIDYIKRYDTYTFVDDHPSDRTLFTGPKGRFVLKYYGFVGSDGVALVAKDSQPPGLLCYLAFFPKGTDTATISGEVTRLVTAARNSGIAVNCTNIGNCGQ